MRGCQTAAVTLVCFECKLSRNSSIMSCIVARRWFPNFVVSKGASIYKKECKIIVFVFFDQWQCYLNNSAVLSAWWNVLWDKNVDIPSICAIDSHSGSYCDLIHYWGACYIFQR